MKVNVRKLSGLDAFCEKWRGSEEVGDCGVKCVKDSFKSTAIRCQDRPV